MSSLPGEKAETVIDCVGPAFAGVLATLHVGAFAEGEIWTEETIRNVLLLTGTQAFLARRGAMPVGFVIFRQVLDDAEILTLAVARKVQKSGIGQALVTAVARHAALSGCTRIFLEVAVRNDAARALYKRCGYAHCGYRRAYYADGGDALVLASDLTTTNR